MTDSDFLTVSNMVSCIALFSDHMQAKYNVDVRRLVGAQEMREIFLEEMEGTRDAHAMSPNPPPLKQLNNQCMNRVKQRLIQRLTGTPANEQQTPPSYLQPRSAQQVKVLEREQVIYADRQVVPVDNLQRPAFSGSRTEAQTKSISLDALASLRDADIGSAPINRPLPEACHAVSESALDEEEFTRRLKKIEQDRDNVLPPPSPDANITNEQVLDAQNSVTVMNTGNLIATVTGASTGSRVIKAALATKAISDVSAPPSSPIRGRIIRPLGRKNEKDMLQNITDKNDRTVRMDRSAFDRLDAGIAGRVRIEDADPKAIIQPLEGSAVAAAIAGNRRWTSMPMDLYAPSAAFQPQATDVQPIQAAPRRQAVRTRYLSICGADRDWTLQRQRYAYTVQLGGLRDNATRDVPRNVVSVAVTRVVLPMESIKHQTVPGMTVCRTRGIGGDSSFAYPYLVVHISELGSPYDGTNGVVRDAFCKLTYDTDYCSASGRGFIVLKPMQDEERVFAPTPLDSMSRLSIQLLKPNGTLFNNSIDNYEVVKIEYEAFNPHLVKIVLDKYFDAKEFAVGDSLVVKSMAFDGTAAALRRLEAFVNRPEGHEIIQLGDANDAGFFRTMYILAPGTLDQDVGRVINDSEALTELVNYNGQLTSVPVTGTAGNGKLINTTLQTVYAMRIKVLEPRAN